MMAGDTIGDLETAYELRGEAIVICNERLKLSNDHRDAERDLIDRWTNPRPWWAFWNR